MERKYWKLPLVSVFSIFERLSIIENTVSQWPFNAALREVLLGSLENRTFSSRGFFSSVLK